MAFLTLPLTVIDSVYITINSSRARIHMLAMSKKAIFENADIFPLHAS